MLSGLKTSRKSIVSKGDRERKEWNDRMTMSELAGF